MVTCYKKTAEIPQTVVPKIRLFHVRPLLNLVESFPLKELEIFFQLGIANIKVIYRDMSCRE